MTKTVFHKKQSPSSRNQWNKFLVISLGVAFTLNGSLSNAFLDKFTSASQSKVSSVLSYNSAPQDVVMKIGRDIPRGGQNALLNVNFRRPFVPLTEVPKELVQMFQRDPGQFQKMADYLQTVYPQFVSNGFTVENLINEFYVIGNFAHGMFGYNTPQDFINKEPGDNTESRYWLALIPKKITSTQMNLQIETFGGGEAKHMQIRADLDAPILLIPQPQVAGQSFDRIDWNHVLDKTVTPSPEDALGLPLNNPVLIRGNMIYSLMANSFKEGPKEASFVNGINGYLAVGMVLASQTHMALDQLPRSSFVRDYKLPMNSNQRQTLLKYILTPNYLSPIPSKDSDSFMAPVHYNTVFYNCINAALEAINVGLTEQGRDLSKSINVFQFNPFVVPDYLKQKNIISDYQMVELNKLPNYSIIAKSKTEKVLGFVQEYGDLMYSTSLDAMVRQFAYQVAVNEWSSQDIDYVIALASSAPSQVITKSLRKMAIEKLILTRDTLDPKLTPRKIVEIATSMDQIIKTAMKAGAWEFTKKKIVNPIYNLPKKFIGLLGLARIS